MCPYPCFEDSWLKVACMQIYISDFVVCAKNKSYVDVKNIKSITHIQKHFLIIYGYA